MSSCNLLIVGNNVSAFFANKVPRKFEELQLCPEQTLGAENHGLPTNMPRRCQG